MQRCYGLDLRVLVASGGGRRLWVLISQLPPEANVWREDAWPLPVEFQALWLERLDLWGRAIVSALLHEKAVPVPGPLEIRRPGEREPERPKFDPHRIAQGLKRMFSR